VQGVTATTVELYPAGKGEPVIGVSALVVASIM
jgi:hypothetical protein